MSPAAYSEPTPTLTAQRGGLAPAATPTKMHPSEIALTLPAAVLRLPYPPATRLILAEIMSLYAANAGCCDASDAHFAARLTINKDTANVAVQLLEKDGLVTKVVVRQPTGFYRMLTPNLAAIAAKAATNPYPENTAGPTRKFRAAKPEFPATLNEPPAGNSGQPYPEFPVTPTRKNPLPLAGNSVSNTPLNSPVGLHQSSISSADASATGPEKKRGEDFSAQLPTDAVQVVPPVAKPPHKKVRQVNEPADFADFWQVWPKKVARADAVKAFAKLAPDDQTAAASRADAWLAANPDLADPTRYGFIPYPATWLNKARWTDQAPTAQPAATYATANATSYSPRPVNGHKPSGNAGQLARALFTATQSNPDSAGVGAGREMG